MATPRTTCKDLLNRLRDLIGDPAGVEAGSCVKWTQDQLQTALDDCSERVRYLELRALETRTPGGGAVEYLDFAAPYGDWENTAVLTDARGTVLTPATANLQLGEWTLETEPDLPVYLNGRTFDLYRAAADMLEKWAAAKKLEFTFSPGSGQFVRSQQHSMTLTTAAGYRARQRPRFATIVREDVNAF
jgi:hypothetical protein